METTIWQLRFDVAWIHLIRWPSSIAKNGALLHSLSWLPLPY